MDTVYKLDSGSKSRIFPTVLCVHEQSFTIHLLGMSTGTNTGLYVKYCTRRVRTTFLGTTQHKNVKVDIHVQRFELCSI